MAEFVLPVREADPYVRVASSVRQEGVQRPAYPFGTARRFPVHVFRDFEAQDGLKERRASRAALRKADPALTDIDAYNGSFFAEQGAEGRGRRNGKRRDGRSWIVVFRGCAADMIQQFLCGIGLTCG